MSFVSISIVHAFRDLFSLLSSVGPCTSDVDLLIELTVLILFIDASL